MARISGVELPAEKRIDIGLTAIYGIGRSNVIGILKKAKVEANKKVKDLTDVELTGLQKIVETIPVEGILRKKVSEDVSRLKTIGTYRGVRHTRGLPARGQRTRTNARTKRGKRKTIGALKKEDAGKLGAPKEATSAS
jgi:small subunit ribosomal protein S13